MVWPDLWKSALVICLVSLLLYPAVRADVPVSYITESVTANYDTDGSLAGPVERLGRVEVMVPNTQDVLQYILLNLSGTQHTNLQSGVAYKGVAASPNPGDRTRIYMNTTSGTSNISYEIDSDVTPVICLRLDYANNAGGRDLYSGGTNTLFFNLTINSTQPLTGVSLYLRFARNTLGVTDSVSLYGADASAGSAVIQDGDSDGLGETLYWSGNTGTSDVNVWFWGNITPGINFDENEMAVDLDQGTTSQASRADNTGTFTGISFTDRMARGPIRQGITMLTIQNWVVRGFITNIAQGLDYRIHTWRLYKIGESEPVISSSPEIYPFGPGETAYTEWYDTSVPQSQDKQGYYSSYWDWETGWGSSEYSGTSLATITLPVLHEIDAWVDKSVIINENTESGTVMSVQDMARHMGHSALSVKSMSINSVLPHTSSGGTTNTWIPSGIRVLYVNASGQTDITSQVSIATQPSESGDGFVNVDIPDMSAVIGRNLQQNDDVRVEYTAAGSSHAVTQTYRFCQRSTMLTLSGTPVSKSVCQDIVIPGIGGVHEPGPGGGPGGGPVGPALYADIVKEMGEGYFIADNLVRVLATYVIVDTGTKGVKDIKTVIYVPEHGSLDTSSISFKVYDRLAGRWDDWTMGVDYKLGDNGITTVDGRKYREHVITRISSGGLIEEGLDMFDGDKIEIGYVTTVPVGTSFLITRSFGYNYYDDSHIFEDLYIPVRREGLLHDLDVIYGEWQLERAYVGVPVRWTMNMDVCNPNNVSVEQSVSVEVFRDTISARVIREGEAGGESLILKGDNTTYVDMILRLGPGGRKSCVLEAVTPPVLETRREVSVIESSEREIRFMVNVTLENFALGGYEHTSLLFKNHAGKIIYVTEEGKALNYSGYDDSTTEIFLGEMEPGQERKLTIVFIEVPPTLITSVDPMLHACSNSMNMTVFVVPSEKETESYLEIEIVGPGPQLKTVYSQIIEMRDMFPWEEIEIPLVVDISSFPDGRYVVYSSFKKNFQTILSDQSDFFVDCPERTIISIGWLGFLGLALVVVIYAAIRSYRRRGEENVEALKKKLRELE